MDYQVEHKCEEYKFGCTCGSLAEEPDDCCPTHGGCYVKPRCICGKFVRRKAIESLIEKIRDAWTPDELIKEKK